MHEMYEEAMRGVRHLLVQKSIPNGLVFIGELPNGPKGSVSPKMDELVCDYKLVDIYIQRKLMQKVVLFTISGSCFPVPLMHFFSKVSF